LSVLTTQGWTYYNTDQVFNQLYWY